MKLFLALLIAASAFAQTAPPKPAPIPTYKVGDAVSIPLLPRMAGATACTAQPLIGGNLFPMPRIIGSAFTAKATRTGFFFYRVSCTLNGKPAMQIVRFRVAAPTPAQSPFPRGPRSQK